MVCHLLVRRDNFADGQINNTSSIYLLSISAKIIQQSHSASEISETVYIFIMLHKSEHFFRYNLFIVFSLYSTAHLLNKAQWHFTTIPYCFVCYIVYNTFFHFIDLTKS